MLPYGGQLHRLAVHRDPLDRLLPLGAKHERQPDDVIEMRVREQDVERRRRDMLPDAEKAGPGIEDNAGFRQHQARRMPPFRRMIPARSKQEQFHGARRKVGPASTVRAGPPSSSSSGGLCPPFSLVKTLP